MQRALLWVYIVNTVLLVDHEIESAYWKEWELFGLPGGIQGFVFMHLPILFVLLLGVEELCRRTPAGSILSLIAAAGGLFAFCVHTYFVRKGRPGFNLAASKVLLWGMLVLSIVQAAMSVVLLASGGAL
jgi:hypothetical protein